MTVPDHEEPTYRLTEIVGTSQESIQQAVRNGVARAAETVLQKARLVQLLPAIVRRRTDRLAQAAANLARLSPVQQIARREEALRERARRLQSAASARLTRGRNALASRRADDRLERALAERFAVATRGLAHRRDRLIALSPEGVLSRGYSITVDTDTGAVVRSASETAVDRKVRIRLATGRLAARVEQVEP